jgi:hypothetical protein
VRFLSLSLLLLRESLESFLLLRLEGVHRSQFREELQGRINARILRRRHRLEVRLLVLALLLAAVATLHRVQ